MTVTKKKPIPRRAIKPEVTEPVAPGDTIEYSISMEIRGPAGALWLKAGVSSQVRAGETTEQAEERVTSYVEHVVKQKAEDIAHGRA